MSATTRPRTDVTTSSSRTRIFGAGLVAAATAAAATTLIALSALAIGVDFEVPEGSGESIPLSAFPITTFVLSVLGVAGAVAIHRWNRRPIALFLRVALTLTALSLIPPVFAGANAGTSVSLVLAHLVAAAIVIPVLASRLSVPTYYQ